MIVGIPRESLPGETRVAATPQTVGQIIKLGYTVVVESGAGAASSFSDAAYVEAGATIGSPWNADVVLKVNAPDDSEIAAVRDGATVVGLISPALRPDLVEKLSSRPITVLAMDAVPRISRAQSLDVLSSMANIAGYRAVVEAAHAFGRFFTGQVTAAGKVPQAKVLVVGAGVAGLAAIGAAGSLGAIVKATDPRPRSPIRSPHSAGSTCRSRTRRKVSLKSPQRATPRRWTTTTRPAKPPCMPSWPPTSTSSSPPR